MIPLRDHNKTQGWPIVTKLLLAINIGVFIYMLTLGERELAIFIATYALEPREIVNGQDWMSLITSMFLHGGFGHIIGNMLFLNIFGDNLEDAFGKVKYLLYYLACGLAGSALQIWSDPLSTIPNLGASGAIAGLMGGYLLMFPRHRVDVLIPFGGWLHEANVPAYTMLVYWFIGQLFSGVGSLSGEGVGVAYFAHIGGFVAGIILLPFLRPKGRTYDWTDT